MRTLFPVFGIFCGGASVILFLIAFWSSAYRLGHKDGRRDGYREGFTDAENLSDLWWEVAEHQVDQARKKIWQKDGEKKWP